MLVLTRNMVRLRKSTLSAKAQGLPLIKESKKKVERFLGKEIASESIAPGMPKQRGCSIVNS